VSSTSTNKQPLLIDRPLHQFAILGATAALTSGSNFATIVGGACVALVDCSSNDGACVDSISIVAMQASTTASSVLVFLSSSSTPFGITDTNTALVATATIGSTSAGERTNISLPPLAVPVPSLGGQASPTETSKKNTGILVEAGQVLYVGLNAAIISPTPATKVNVFAQGGFY
jgi:hypothetical protein